MFHLPLAHTHLCDGTSRREYLRIGALGMMGLNLPRALRAAGQASWAETLRQAKELGSVDVQACSLSMDLLAIESTDLDPLVDGVEGVAAFYDNAGDGQVLFI